MYRFRKEYEDITDDYIRKLRKHIRLIEGLKVQPEEGDIWDTTDYSMGDLITALVTWGNGSGEELYDYLTTIGFDGHHANAVLNMLNDVIRRMEIHNKEEVN